MAQQYSGWTAGQLVTAAQMNAFSNDMYQRFYEMFTDKPVPFIASGLTISSISSSGLATITAGVAIDEPFASAEAPYLPGTNLASIGVLASSNTLQITATGPEFGLLVLRQTVTPTVANQANYTIVSTLTYVPGSSSAYPAITKHDVVLAGVVITGSIPTLDYVLDYTLRACDEPAYAATMAQIGYAQNPHMDDWSNGTGPIPVGPGNSAESADDWYVLNNGSANDVTVNQELLDPAELTTVFNSPEFAIQCVRTVAEASNTGDAIYQDLPNFRVLNGKYVVITPWIKATSGANIAATMTLTYDAGDGILLPISYIDTDFSIIADGVYRPYTFALAIPVLSQVLAGSLPNSLRFSLTWDNSVTYSISVTEFNNNSGKFYVPIYRQLGVDLIPPEEILTTGDAMFSLKTTKPGWVAMNDGTIGNQSSNATTRANGDTVQLFTMMWSLPDNLCPLYDSTGVKVSRGASAAADYAANTQLTMVRCVGRALCVTGSTGGLSQTAISRSGSQYTVADTSNMYTGTAITITTTGTLPNPLLVGTTYYVINTGPTTFLLAATLADIGLGMPIALGVGGTGVTNFIVTFAATVPGQYAGEFTHLPVLSEMLAHTHVYEHVDIAGSAPAFLDGGGTQKYFELVPTASTGGGNPFNITQPSVFMNFFMKL